MRFKGQPESQCSMHFVTAVHTGGEKCPRAYNKDTPNAPDKSAIEQNKMLLSLIFGRRAIDTIF